MAHIQQIEVHLPEKILTNDELANVFPDWTAEKIFEKTGILERRIAAATETASDLAIKAAEKLFSSNPTQRHDVDFLILCTQAPDYFLPTSACIVHEALALSPECGAIDVNQGCSGYVYSLSLATGLVEAGLARNVLVITADTYSKSINEMDKSVRTLFGDGATASIISASQGTLGKLGKFVFGSDGKGAKNLIIPTGGFREPRTKESSETFVDGNGNKRSRDNLFMNGANVMSFSLTEVPKAIDRLLNLSRETIDDFDFIVLHQANKFMLEALRKKIKVPRSKVPHHFSTFGNTVSSTIPIALHCMRQDGHLKKGTKLILCGFGVGYSWAACTLDV